MKYILLINKLFKKIKSKFLIKRVFQKLLNLIAIFDAIIIINVEIVYYIDIIIYENVVII